MSVMAVLRKWQGCSKLDGIMKTERNRFHGHFHPVQMAALPGRDYFALRPVVPPGAPCHGLQYPASGRKNREEVLWVNGLPGVERQRGQEHACKARRGQSVVATGLARPAR